MGPVKNVLKACRKWAYRYGQEVGTERSLAGLCAIASVRIHKSLKQKGVKSKIVVADFYNGGSHCFVQVGEEILDVTATQFGLPAILKQKKETYIRTLLNNPVVELKIKETLEFEDVSSLTKHLHKSGWPSEQIP